MVTGVLDFEFCAFDWRCMELVVGVSKYCGAKDPLPLLKEYIAGYAAGGGKFTEAEVKLIPDLIILRVLNNVVFFVGRYLAKEDSIEPIAGVRKRARCTNPATCFPSHSHPQHTHTHVH